MRFLLLLFFASASCLAQIPKNADRIEVKTSLPDSVLYEKVIDLLQSDNWTRARQDDKRRELVTEYKPTKHVWNVRMLVSVKQSTVLLRGEVRAEAMGVKIENQPVSYKGMGGAMNKVNFERMNDFAVKLKDLITNSTINYPL